MSPRIPSWMRSSSVSSEPWYFFAIETTSRRFALIIRSFAARSPFSMGRGVALAERGGGVDRRVGGQQPVAADLVQEELERVGGGRRERRVVERRGVGLPPAVVAQVDPALLDP